MKPEQKLTLQQIQDKLPALQFKVKDALRWKDSDVLGPKVEADLQEALHEIQLYISHYLNYPS